MEQFEHLQDLSIHSSCRTCLEKLKEMDIHHDIFNIPDLQKKLASCSLLAVEPGDGLPTNLCELCHRRIDDFYKFQQMCINAKKRFEDFMTLDKKPCSMEILIDPNNLPTDLMMFSEAKEENQDDDPLPFDQFSEVVKQEPIADVKDQIEMDQIESSSDNDETYQIQSSSSSDEEKDIKVRHKRKTTHTKTKLAKSKLECKTCEKTFMKAANFEAHMREHNGLKAYPCQQCGKSYSHKNKLKSHIKDHHEGESMDKEPNGKFPCTELGCDSIMSTKKALQQHCKENHWTNGKKPRPRCICEECGKVFRSVYYLKAHRYVHNGEELPHECPQCNKRFVTKHNLNNHIKRHNGTQWKLTCPICGVKKVKKYDLTKHINSSHTRETKYPCQYCDSVFYSLSNIKRHIQIVHEGLKEFKCAYCERTFGERRTRKHHEMTHTGEKPHECNICHKKFIQSVALKKHQEVHLKQLKNQTNEQQHAAF